MMVFTFYLINILSKMMWALLGIAISLDVLMRDFWYSGFKLFLFHDFVRRIEDRFNID